MRSKSVAHDLSFFPDNSSFKIPKYDKIASRMLHLIFPMKRNEDVKGGINMFKSESQFWHQVF